MPLDTSVLPVINVMNIFIWWMDYVYPAALGELNITLAFRSTMRMELANVILGSVELFVKSVLLVITERFASIAMRDSTCIKKCALVRWQLSSFSSFN